MTKWRRACLASVALFAACGLQGADAPAAQDPCHVHLAPSEDDHLSIQSALLGSAPGSVVCLESGTYELADGLSLGVPGLTLRALDEGAVLDFSRQRAPAPGLAIQGDDVTVEGLEFRDARGPAVRVEGSDNVRLASLRILWTRSGEGTSGIDLREASNTRVTDVEVVGAKRGILSADSVRLVVEGSSLHHNEVGAWFEGGSDLELTGTELRSNRSGLVLATSRAGAGERAKIHGNLIEGSRGDARDPLAGLGIALVGPFTAEIHDNVVRSNDAAGLLVLGTERGAEPAPFFLSVHDNRFVGNGEGPSPERDLVVMEGETSSWCFERNEGTVQAAEGMELDAGCPLAPIPAPSL